MRQNTREATMEATGESLADELAERGRRRGPLEGSSHRYGGASVSAGGLLAGHEDAGEGAARRRSPRASTGRFRLHRLLVYSGKPSVAGAHPKLVDLLTLIMKRRWIWGF